MRVLCVISPVWNLAQSARGSPDDRVQELVGRDLWFHVFQIQGHCANLVSREHHGLNPIEHNTQQLADAIFYHLIGYLPRQLLQW